MGGSFLGITPVARTRFDRNIQFRKPTFDQKHGLVGLSVLGFDAIIRKRHAARLHQFLQPRFRVFACQRIIIQPVSEQPDDEFANGVHTPINERGSKDGLERVRQEGISAKSATAQLPRAQPQVVTQINLPGYGCERFTIYDICAHQRQVMFLDVGIALIQQLRDRKTQRRVAEKLETFIVDPRHPPVGQGEQQQRLVGEFVTEPEFELIEFNVRRLHALRRDLRRMM